MAIQFLSSRCLFPAGCFLLCSANSPVWVFWIGCELSSSHIPWASRTFPEQKNGLQMDWYCAPQEIAATQLVS